MRIIAIGSDPGNTHIGRLRAEFLAMGRRGRDRLSMKRLEG
jgi:hypothetical protein